MEVVILMGISGAGKSTYAKKLVGDRGPESADVVSADDFFMHEGEYNFDPSKLSEAHGLCFRRFIRRVTERDAMDLLVVDNTNTSVAEIAPYVLGAQAYGCDVKVVRICCPVGVALGRNIHGVPSNAVVAMAARIQKTLAELPPWWKFEEVEG